MANLLVDERDVKFVLYEQLEIEQLSNTAKYAEYSKEMYDLVLEQAWKLAENEMAPANRNGDEQGCAWADGQVRVPESYHRPYEMYRQGGWLSMAESLEAGGAGIPGRHGARGHRSLRSSKFVPFLVPRTHPWSCQTP